MSIPLKFLRDSSRNMVGEYELAKLNRAANLRKELRALVEQIIDETAEARFARWLIEHREELFTTIPIDISEDPLDLGGDSDRKLSS